MDDLSKDDLQALRAFAWKVHHHTPNEAFADLPHVFPDVDLESWKLLRSHIAKLSGFEPQVYDCCRKSCICFVGPHSDLTECPYCHLARLDAHGKPFNTFVYLPLTSRLQQFFMNSDMGHSLRYRAKGHIHEDGVIKDVMDSSLYLNLCGKHVEINGRPLDHKFFEDERDIALGLSTDGFAPFRRRKKTAWPLILFNYNLPPEVRFHYENILPLGVIPGPDKPKDFDSFLWPLVQELIRLEIGVHTYDQFSDTFFALHAYLLLVFGDIPAISMVMRMKGHNATCPCRMCTILGVPVPHGRGVPLYVPLDRTHHPSVRTSASAVKAYDPANLPLRTHAEFIRQATAVHLAPTETESAELAKRCGIKGLSLLSSLSSLSFPQSFPYDFMHLLWENVMKNMMQLWTGSYKGLATGTEDYELHPTVWAAIGEACEKSGSSIPSAFGPRPPNVATDKMSWTAESRAFWTLYMGPVLLRNRFAKRTYYDHFIELVKLLNTCLQFELSLDQVSQIRQGFIEWVKKYEEYVLVVAILPMLTRTLQHILPA